MAWCRVALWVRCWHEKRRKNDGSKSYRTHGRAENISTLGSICVTIRTSWNINLISILKHVFECFDRSIRWFPCYSRCCKLLVVALLRVTVRQEDCVDWLRQHGAKDVGLVGHSRGGVTISQLEGDFCRVTWMTWILKAMVLAEFRDPIHPIRIWGEHRWISTTSSRSWRYIQKRSGRTHADHLWCRRRDLVLALHCRWTMLHGCNRTQQPLFYFS